MRIVMWIGNEENQRALANKMAEHFDVVGIVTESRISNRKWTLRKLVEKGIERIFLNQIRTSWFGMKNYYSTRYPDYPGTDRIDVANINSAEAVEFTEQRKPDLILVSGTRLVKEKNLSLGRSIGILNLHTGLSPYIKGGPNCTNWCLVKRQSHLIGNTVMWIDKGIDTGNILTTELTELTGKENLLEIHIKVMEHAHDLFIAAVRFIQRGGESSVNQSGIAQGKTYYTKNWTLIEKFKLNAGLKRFREVKKNHSNQQSEPPVDTISIR